MGSINIFRQLSTFIMKIPLKFFVNTGIEPRQLGPDARKLTTVLNTIFFALARVCVKSVRLVTLY